MKKIKYILTVASFALVIFGLAIAHLIVPDKAVSSSERRELAQAPSVTAKAVFNREFSDKLESYMLDQFPMRESFRQVNAATRFYAMGQLDSNGIWIDGDRVYKNEPVTNENQIAYAYKLYNAIIDSYLKDCHVYWSIIPDKSYYAEDKNHPHIDYDRLIELMTSNVNGKYIDITGTLDTSKYYRTDTHWLQPELFDTVKALGEGMGVGEYLTDKREYTPHTLSPFYGVYLGQAALPIKPDELTYLTSPYTEGAKVSYMSNSGVMEESSEGVYTLSKFEGMDGYDVFLGGTQSIIEIVNEDAKTDRELYVFRDSFGSSFVPLFTGAYKQITVIDLRYVTSQYLPNFVEFTPDSDVLFINSTIVLNTAMIMR